MFIISYPMLLTFCCDTMINGEYDIKNIHPISNTMFFCGIKNATEVHQIHNKISSGSFILTLDGFYVCDNKKHAIHSQDMPTDHSESYITSFYNIGVMRIEIPYTSLLTGKKKLINACDIILPILSITYNLSEMFMNNINAMLNPDDPNYHYLITNNRRKRIFS